MSLFHPVNHVNPVYCIFTQRRQDAKERKDNKKPLDVTLGLGLLFPQWKSRRVRDEQIPDSPTRL